MINDNKKVIAIQQKLIENGYIVGAIRQPTVQQAIIRMIIKLNIKTKDIKKTIEIIQRIKNG